MAGKQDLNITISGQVKCLAGCISQSILYNMKWKSQAQCIPKTDSFARRKSYQTAQQIGLVLAVRNSDRNNEILNSLSVPGYGITTSIKQTLLCETRIANAAIKIVVLKEFILMPFNLKENAIPMLHLDSIDWIKDTPDGKNTSHLLQLNIFQLCINEKCKTQSYFTKTLLKVLHWSTILSTSLQSTPKP